MRALMEAIAITLGEMKIPVIEKDF
jgi:hypothetical protein